VALADADAGENPVVSGVDHLFEVCVGEEFGRHIGAEGADFGAYQIRQLELLGMKGSILQDCEQIV
jgi:hypothetical protein